MKQNKHESITLIMAQFLRIINKYNGMHKTAMSFGIGMKLQPSEIHTIEAIGRNEGINITELARILGITKGGVSQMVGRLIRKKLSTKTRDQGTDKEVRIALTVLGRKAYHGHMNFHSVLYNDFTKYFSAANTREIDTLRGVLSKAEKHLDQIMKNLG
jgi:DNA-binding MarR family transcriptional regulator